MTAILLERPPLQAPSPERPTPTPAASWPTERRTPRQLRQLIISLVVLPLTVLPFVAYLTMTPEGRLVRDRVLVRLFPPQLPTLSPQQRAAALVAAPRYTGAVMALAYHGVGSSSDAEGGFVISAARFGEHLATLKAAGLQAVTATQVAEAFRNGTPLPDNAVMITFDDGRADAMMFADPLLKQAGMSATMFVIASAASKPGVYYASWDNIESYARSGRWDIQSHTAASHREQKAAGGQSLPALTSLAPGESLAEYRARVHEDLSRAAAAIQEHVGRRPVAFAYPFGAYGADRTNDPAVAEVLREEVARQYGLAFQQDDQETVPLLTAAQDRLLLRRVEVENWSGLELLHRIAGARQMLLGTQAAAPALSPAPLAATTDGAPVTSTSVAPPAAPPGAAPNPPVSSLALAAAPALSAAPVTTAVPPVTSPSPTAPATSPPASPSPAPPTTAPPITAPPVTSPPTTAAPPTARPPTTPPTPAPPTTVCKSAGNSGKCIPGQS